MRASHIIVYFAVVTMLCFVLKNTGVCISTFSCSPSSHINVQGIRPRRALSSYPTQQDHNELAKSVIEQEMDRKAKSLMSSSHGEEDDDVVYHIDYHGVMTHHPAPTPKHPQP